LEQFLFKQFWKYELLQNLKISSLNVFQRKRKTKKEKLQEESSYLTRVGHGSGNAE
jgi:hypothetical protein